MATALDKNCTFLISTEKAGTLQQEDILKDLESSDVNSKIRCVQLITSKQPFTIDVVAE
jgi:hypothetical protein